MKKEQILFHPLIIAGKTDIISSDAIIKLNNFKYFGFFNRFLSFIPASVQTVTQGRFIEANASATSKILSMELTTEYKVNAVSVSVQPLGLIH